MENRIVRRIKDEFIDIPDLVMKKIKISFLDTIYVLYLESVSSSNKVNDYILKNLSNISSFKTKKFDFPSILPSPNTKEIKNIDEVEYFITSGFTIVVYKDSIYGIETRADINRGIPTPDSEPSPNGPKDAFTENYQINMGLIKKRLKSSKLKTKEYTIGRKTLTKVGLLYFCDIAEDELVKKVDELLRKIDIDGILDSSFIGKLISDENKTHFPLYQLSERPDFVSKALLEGKIAIVVDTSPFVLILPSFFIDFINPGIDEYHKSKNINFLKVIRFICFFLSMSIPAIYIALVNYNQETIPTMLLVSFSIQHDGVPFPSIIEVLIMLFICEMLRESDLRFPNAYGSAISILGALVLGDAAVAAGIVSPITIIIIALTFMSSLMFTEIEITSTLRSLRLLFIFSASFFGVLGLLFALFYFLIRINRLESFGKPYFYPLIPFDKTYFFKTVFKSPLKKDIKRSSILTHKNKIKQGEKV